MEYTIFILLLSFYGILNSIGKIVLTFAHAQTFNGNRTTKKRISHSHRTNKHNQSILDTQNMAIRIKVNRPKWKDKCTQAKHTEFGIWNNADSSMSLDVSVQVVKFMRRPTDRRIYVSACRYCYCFGVVVAVVVDTVRLSHFSTFIIFALT